LSGEERETKTAKVPPMKPDWLLMFFRDPR